MTAKIKNSGCKEFPYYLVMVGKKEFCATNNKENAQKIIELFAIAERMPTEKDAIQYAADWATELDDYEEPHTDIEKMDYFLQGERWFRSRMEEKK
jgi:hypothetical protein